MFSISILKQLWGFQGHCTVFAVFSKLMNCFVHSQRWSTHAYYNIVTKQLESEKDVKKE